MSAFRGAFTGCGTASMVLSEPVLTTLSPVGSTLATGADSIAGASRQPIGPGLRSCQADSPPKRRAKTLRLEAAEQAESSMVCSENQHAEAGNVEILRNGVS